MNKNSTNHNLMNRLSQQVFHRFSKTPKTREDINNIFQRSHDSGIIDDDALGIMEGALRIMEMQARDIMIPYSQMCVLNIEDSKATCLKTIVDTGHSRFPVLDDDEVAGIVLAKDFIDPSVDQDNFNLRKILRDPSIIPESKRLSVLLREFREQRYHMAIVIDEYGGISGLITIEDVLEEIVGEIEDETDEQETSLIQSLPPNKTNNRKQFMIQTQLQIADFNEAFNCGFSDADFDTIGGFLMHHFGRIPEVDESIAIDNFLFTVSTADERRIISALLEVAS